MLSLVGNQINSKKIESFLLHLCVFALSSPKKIHILTDTSVDSMKIIHRCNNTLRSFNVVLLQDKLSQWYHLIFHKKCLILIAYLKAKSVKENWEKSGAHLDHGKALLLDKPLFRRQMN